MDGAYKENKVYKYFETYLHGGRKENETVHQ